MLQVFVAIPAAKFVGFSRKFLPQSEGSWNKNVKQVIRNAMAKQ
jgi:hypothetical protein